MNQDETTLRKNIRHLIRHVKQKNLNEEKLAEQLLSKLIKHEIRSYIIEASVPDVDPTPNKSTGINVLEELLKKIIPVLQVDYKSLTTNKVQRDSYRAHIINAVVNTLTPAKINTDAGPEDLDEDIEEEVDVTITDEPDEVDDKFIDIRTDAEKAEEEPEEDPVDSFAAGVEGDETGRNVAFQSFKKIETSIIDSYELLADPEDQELFYDYLIANLKLYFDKFEDELDSSVEEPTNQAYDSAKQGSGDDLSPLEEEYDLEI